MQQAPDAIAKATAGKNQQVRVVPESKSVGTESTEDFASAFVTVDAGSHPSTYLISQWMNSRVNRAGISPYFSTIEGGPQNIEVNGKPYQLEYALPAL